MQAMTGSPSNKKTLESDVVRKRYNRGARFYDREQAMMERVAGEWRRELWSRVANGDVLEVGVGTGINMPLYPSGAHVTGIDIAENMLSRAGARAEKLGIDVDLRQMDIEHLDFPDRQFASTTTPTISPAYDKTLDQPVFDPSQAKALLKEAGFPNGISSAIKLDTLPIRAYAPAIAQLLQQQGKEVGLNLVFEPLEYNSMLDRFYKGQLDNLWVGFGDASSGLSPAAAVRASSTIGNDVVTHANDPAWVTARDAIKNGASTADAYKQFNNAYLDQAFQFPLSRSVPVDFQSKNIHISRNYLGGANYYEVWKG